jgi:hypothetical protein
MLSGAKHLGFGAAIGRTMPKIFRSIQDDNCLILMLKLEISLDAGAWCLELCRAIKYI